MVSGHSFLHRTFSCDHLPICATVNIIDSRAVFKVDIEFYMQALLRPLLESLYQIGVLLLTSTVDSSSYVFPNYSSRDSLACHRARNRSDVLAGKLRFGWSQAFHLFTER